jgi:hypothetical protein
MYLLLCNVSYHSAPALSVNIRLGWKIMTATNTLAYYDKTVIITVPSNQNGVLTGLYLKGRLLALPTKIRLGWK